MNFVMWTKLFKKTENRCGSVTLKPNKEVLAQEQQERQFDAIEEVDDDFDELSPLTDKKNRYHCFFFFVF